MRPILFYTIGYPGAGKTTLATRLSHWLSAEHLRGDKIGLELFKYPTFSLQERRMVYAEMNKRAAMQLTADRNALYDASANTFAQRQQLTALAHKYGGEAVGLWVQVPIAIARRRAGTARDQGISGGVIRIIPPNIFEQYVAAFEAPQNDEPVLIMAGDKPFHAQYARLFRELNGIVKLPKLVQ
ncbi:MAG TPA: ATP-binding protein [Patescibacteria group bacterium]|nr:ATP-binding protein [Patescibacteria group bacterium]